MSKHQIIYTSCRRGIDRITDGQQVYSYDALFSESNSPEIHGLFSYTPPVGSADMTDGLAAIMPQAFLYRRLRSGAGAVALNTYLGRDYTGPNARFGNHISHAVICDGPDFTVYPCELYGSTLFRDRLSSEEVNSREKPPHLPAPELTPGDIVSVDSVTRFLSVPGRLETFKKMLRACIAGASDGKRLLICDLNENIINWIAALHYAFPLHLALTVSFTTYEYNPARSMSRICGIVPTREEPSGGYDAAHYVFDFLSASSPEENADPPLTDFCDFIAEGLSGNYRGLQNFHNFVADNLPHVRVGPAYCHSYTVFRLFSGENRAIPFGELCEAIMALRGTEPPSDATAFLGKTLEAVPAERLSSDDQAFSMIARLVFPEKAPSAEWRRTGRSIIDLHQSSPESLLSMALKLDSLLSGPAAQPVSADLWRYVTQIIAGQHSGNGDDRRRIRDYLLSNEKTAQVYDLYHELLAKVQSIQEAAALFSEMEETVNHDFSEMRYNGFLQAYYNCIVTRWNPDSAKVKRELLDVILRRRLNPGFLSKLINDVFEADGAIEIKLVGELLRFYGETPEADMPVYLKMAAFHHAIEKAGDADELVAAALQQSGVGRPDLTGTKNADRFFRSIAPAMFALCHTARDLDRCYRLLILSPVQSAKFIMLWAGEAIYSPDSAMIIAFFSFLFGVGSPDINSGVSSVLRKLSGPDLENLDKYLSDVFKKEKASLRQWRAIAAQLGLDNKKLRKEQR